VLIEYILFVIISSFRLSDSVFNASSYNCCIILTFSCSTMKSLAAFVQVHPFRLFWSSLLECILYQFYFGLVQPWLQQWQSWAMASQNSILLQRWLHFVGNGAYQQTMSGYFPQGAYLLTSYMGSFCSRVFGCLIWHDMLGTIREGSKILLNS
jgi:hypothetical protein